METIQIATEALIQLVRNKIYAEAVLVLPDDVFEVKRTPSVILQGPKLSENAFRRSVSPTFNTDVKTFTFQENAPPRLYHLDFDIIVTVTQSSELLDFIYKLTRFLIVNPILEFQDGKCLNMTELIPLGGLSRVNLSNLRQCAGRIRVEDCPVYSDQIKSGKIIIKRTFQMNSDISEEITL